MQLSIKNVATGATVVASLATAGYQTQKSEMAEMRTSLKIQLNELELARRREQLQKQDMELKEKAAQSEAADKYLAHRNDEIAAMERRYAQLSENLRTVHSVAPATSAASGRSLPYLYIQYPQGDASALATATRVADRLRKEYIVPRPEPRPPSEFDATAQVRYFKENAGNAALQALLEDLRRAQVPGVAPKVLTRGKPPAMSDTFELWLPPSPHPAATASPAPVAAAAVAVAAAAPATLPPASPAPAAPAPEASPAKAAPVELLNQKMLRRRPVKVHGWNVDVPFMYASSAVISITQGDRTLFERELGQSQHASFEHGGTQYTVWLDRVGSLHSTVRLTQQ